MGFLRKPRLLSGYRVVYKPDHFSHHLNEKAYRGYVYEHRYVMECYLNRPLDSDEIVHHKDGNKLNNSIGNLELTTRNDHAHKHLGTSEKNYCVDCGKELSDPRNIRCRDCYCRQKRKVKDRPSKETLKGMLKDHSYCYVGRQFGVSDNTIRKWIK